MREGLTCFNKNAPRVFYYSYTIHNLLNQNVYTFLKVDNLWCALIVAEIN